jgi:hypothetical protein
MNIEQLTEQMISKMQFISKLHKLVLSNNAHAQIQQKKTYALWKGEKMFPSFQVRSGLVKMKKTSKKKVLTRSWEGLYVFVGYVDE